MCIARRVEFKPNDNPFETQVDPLQNYFLYIDMNVSQHVGQQIYISYQWLLFLFTTTLVHSIVYYTMVYHMLS